MKAPGSSILPLSAISPDLLIDFFTARDVPPEVTGWKYLDEAFNRGRERAFVWYNQGRVRGVIGVIPVTLATPGGDRPMVWTCDWLLEDPQRSPGIGIKLLDKVRASYVFAAGVGGSEDTHALVPRMNVRTIPDTALFLHRAFTAAALLEKAEQRYPKLPRLSRTVVGRIPLPLGATGSSADAVAITPGVAPGIGILFDQSAAGQCHVRYEQAHLEWYLGRCPGIRTMTGLAGGADSPEAGALFWCRTADPRYWRAAYRCRPGFEDRIEPLLDQVHQAVARAGGALLSTIVSHLDETMIAQLRTRGYLEGSQRWPLYITAMADPPVCEQGLAQMSYLDTDIACAF